jgi:hypothetical protein
MRRPRRLRRAARSVPEPSTLLMPAAPLVAQLAAGLVPGRADPTAPRLPRCGGCGRPTLRVWCCWVCRFAADGGWMLDRWNPGAPWHDVHTAACEAEALARDPRWYAGSRPPNR